MSPPIGSWATFDACVKDLSRKYGKESATKICGSIEAKSREKHEYSSEELNYMGDYLSDEENVEKLRKKHDINSMDGVLDYREI